ncbi:MAG: hypothetical protein WBF48_02345 [Halarcobacter sp.]
MKSNMDDELSLDKIDDYKGTESKEKRNIVRLVVIFCLVVGAIFAYLKYNSEVSDYIGTKEAPGIVTNKK